MDPVVKAALEAELKVFEKEKTKLEAEITSQAPEGTEIEARVQNLRQQKVALFKAQDKLLEYLIKNDVDEYLVEREKRADYSMEIERLEVKASRALQQLSNATVTVDAEVKRDTHHRYNLPQRKLQEFNGDVREWMGFWSSFEDIHVDKVLTDNDKFQYLLQCIPKTSAARKVIDGFTVSAKNYTVAINTLKNMYGRDRMLIKVFVRDLLQLVIENATKGSNVDFMDLYPKLSSHIRNLGELGVTSDKCEEILYPVVESCLPEDILQAWQRNPNFDEKLDELIKFLNTEVENKMDRSLAKMQFSTATRSPEKSGKGKRDKTDTPAAVAFVNTEASDKKKRANPSCAFCGDNRHESDKCGKAKVEMSLDQKMTALKEKKCCFKCLRQGHFTQRCKRFVRCCICGGQHYEVICSGKRDDNQDGKNLMVAAQYSGSSGGQGGSYYSTSPQQQQSPQLNRRMGLWSQQSSGSSSCMDSKAQFANLTGESQVTLSTLMVVLETPAKRWIVRAFIDTGSEVSYIKEEVAVGARLPTIGSNSFRHQLFGGDVTEKKRHLKHEVVLSSLDGRTRMKFPMNSIKRIAQKINKPQYGPWIAELAKKGIKFHNQVEAADDVHVMFGMDVVAQIRTGGFYRINPHLYAEETVFGWVIGGVEPGARNCDVTTSNFVTTMMVNELTVEKLWSLEAMGIEEDSTTESKEDLEKATIKFFEDTVQRKDDGRYVVHLPWKDGHGKLKSNFQSSLIRLKKVTQDLQKQEFWGAYDKIFKDWENENIIEEVPIQSPDQLQELYLLPHRHVIKENSSTTPVRPVFDASAKGKGGPSLNDCLANGPNLLELIPAIMCRFRKEKVGVVSDIKKAFLQIELTRKDQDALQFLWWKDDTCKELKLYRHRRVVFGVKPSPFLLAATLSHHVKSASQEDPEFGSKLLDSLYVDNSCSSHGGLQEALEFQKKSQELLLPAKFDLRGWEYSNSEERKLVGVLGMLWETKEDKIQLCIEAVKKKLDGPNTKRHLLSIVNSLFDPMGFICAFTVIPKLLLQDCCKLKLGWDDELPETIQVKLDKWKSQISDLENFKIPRWLSWNKDNCEVSVHTCCAASGFAVATSIYLRVDTGSGISVQLVMAKSRVAPVQKKVTIPRLELLACGIGARLTVNHVLKYLELESAPVYYWTDSTTALTWIQGDKDWARFVANRVKAIREITKKEQWFHVPGEVNPADIPSRGCSAKFLIERKFHEGPEWLRKPREFWPNSKPAANEDLVNEEVKKAVVTCLAQVKEESLTSHFLHFYDYHKILRVMGFVVKFIRSMRKRAADRKCGRVQTLLKEEITPATAEDIQRAEQCLLRMVQKEAFTGYSDKRLLGMGAFVDQDGLIRVKTQLLFGKDEFGVRCPIVLPHDHPMVKLLIFKEHSVQCHAGVQILQANLREKYWILKSRRAISLVVTSCPVCRRYLAPRCEVPSAPLPLDRIRDTVAFDVTGVDLAGPLFLRDGSKCWMVLFTCGVFRAVHLELVTTLSTSGFMNAFRRFVSRRGRPSRVYSDNGLNFIGCARLFKEVDWNAVQRYAAVDRISWRFNPPTAAWWGGWWERLIGLCKQLIRRILGKKSVEYEELMTILCDVEATINQRPLTYQSDRKEELLPLCPVQFIKDNPNDNLPEADVIDGRVLRNSARICQTLREELRVRFRREYLGQLQHHAGLKMRTVKPGDVVIIEDDNRKRMEWNLGVVVEVYPGRDGMIRTARVKTKDGVFLRAVQRLYLMEVADSGGIDTEAEDDAVSIEEESPPEKQEKVTRFGRKIQKPTRLGID